MSDEMRRYHEEKGCATCRFADLAAVQEGRACCTFAGKPSFAEGRCGNWRGYANDYYDTPAGARALGYRA